jgi:hypothetical protein
VPSAASRDYEALLLFLQGAYFAATGVWSLVAIGLFQRVTGPKTDIWLVKTVGVLVSVIGAVLMLAGGRERPTLELRALAVGSAAGLAAIDVVYVAKRRIRSVYLLDALAEAILVGALLRYSRHNPAGDAAG